MQFQRFTRFGCLSNWGSYSQQEAAILALEATVAGRIERLDPFARRNGRVVVLLRAFRNIQTRTDVETVEVPELHRQLTRIAERLAAIRLDLLDGEHYPRGHQPVFQNHQPDALVEEIRNYLAYRRANRFQEPSFETGFVVSFRAQPAKFRQLIATGARVLWALDVEGNLSIGDPKPAKHSVVAVGRDVLGAGIAQLEIDARTDMYYSVRDMRQRAQRMRDQFLLSQDDLYLENAQELEAQSGGFEQSLDGWVPPQHQQSTIVLDFDSGHYAPTKAWSKSAEAWQHAGYLVKWSRDARHV